MQPILSNFFTIQQRIDLAETDQQAADALRDMLQKCIEDAEIHVQLLDMLGPVLETLPDTVREAWQQHMPYLDSRGHKLVVPLVSDGHPHGLLTVKSTRRLTKAEVALILGQAQCAAASLERLSWPASPQVFRQIVENANVAIDVADLGGKITYVNNAAAQLYGFDSAQTMIGLNVWQLYHANEQDKVRPQLLDSSKFASGGWIGEVLQKDVNGEPFPVELAIFGLDDPRHKTASFGAIIQDVAEYHYLLTFLQQQAQRLEALNRIGTLLSSLLDRNAILQMAAEEIVKLVGIDHCGIVLLIPEGDKGMLVAEFPVTGAVNATFELKGNPIFHHVQQTDDVFVSSDVPNDPRFDEIREAFKRLGTKSLLAIRLVVKNKLIGSIGLDSISRTREFSFEEIDMLRTLASQIALAIENSDLYARAIEANRLKTEFINNVTHEFRTPLGPIIAFTEMLLSGGYGELNDKIRDRLQRVLENAQRMLALVEDVLDVAKLDSGKMQLDLKVQSIAPLVAKAKESLALKAGEKNLEIKIDLPPDLPNVAVDSERFSQVLFNLLSNAVKFTRSGIITVQAEPFTVKQGHSSKTIPDYADALPDGEWLAVAVHDTGIGIAQQNLDLIFDAFRQVDGSVSRRFEGTGLGLAIARQLTEMHGGKLWVESKIGQGSTFTFALPVQK